MATLAFVRGGDAAAASLLAWGSGPGTFLAHRPAAPPKVPKVARKNNPSAKRTTKNSYGKCITSKPWVPGSSSGGGARDRRTGESRPERQRRADRTVLAGAPLGIASFQQGNPPE
jgi:hypothetical protein